MSQTDITLYFEQLNNKERYGDSLQVWAIDFCNMVSGGRYGKQAKIYNDYKAAMEEVKRLNAAEREKQEGAGADG